MTATPKDLQDEVGRLRAALTAARRVADSLIAEMEQAKTEDPGRRYSVRVRMAVHYYKKHAKTPPESADETQPQAGEDE